LFGVRGGIINTVGVMVFMGVSSLACAFAFHAVRGM
jgi:hypothetical protein